MPVRKGATVLLCIIVIKDHGVITVITSVPEDRQGSLADFFPEFILGKVFDPIGSTFFLGCKTASGCKSDPKYAQHISWEDAGNCWTTSQFKVPYCESSTCSLCNQQMWVTSCYSEQPALLDFRNFWHSVITYFKDFQLKTKQNKYMGLIIQ